MVNDLLNVITFSSIISKRLGNDAPSYDYIAAYIRTNGITDIEDFISKYRNDGGLTKGVLGKDYDVFRFEDTDLLHIEACFEGRFADDEFAVRQAVRDGFKIIPKNDPIFGEDGVFAESLGRDGDEVRDWGWIDTPINRDRIACYINKNTLSKQEVEVGDESVLKEIDDSHTNFLDTLSVMYEGLVERIFRIVVNASKKDDHLDVTKLQLTVHLNVPILNNADQEVLGVIPCQIRKIYHNGLFTFTCQNGGCGADRLQNLTAETLTIIYTTLFNNLKK